MHLRSLPTLCVWIIESAYSFLLMQSQWEMATNLTEANVVEYAYYIKVHSFSGSFSIFKCCFYSAIGWKLSFLCWNANVPYRRQRDGYAFLKNGITQIFVQPWKSSCIHTQTKYHHGTPPLASYFSGQMLPLFRCGT